MDAPTPTTRDPEETRRIREELRALLVASTLGEYEILEPIGEGGMATVYLAHDLALDRLVAIKVMTPALLLTPGMADRFRREARTSASLSHPHIIPVYAVRETDRLLFFVMKYVEGRPLDLIIRDFGPLPIDTVEAILGQVGAALAHAHRRGVIHRDVKPANIMIDEDGWAVVMDFGIAKVEDASGLTTTGSSVGTPYYMSPEQGGQGEVTALSDQYSLGVVAYEMLTGHRPFQGVTVMDLMRAHFFDPPVPVSQIRPDCPERLARVVMRMLEKTPARRWATLDEALGELRTRPLGRDDPVRSQMVILAKSGPRRVVVPRPPTSPTPRSRSQARAAPAGRVRRWWLVVPGLAIAALLARGPGPDSGVPSSGASTEATPIRALPPAGSDTGAITPVPQSPDPAGDPGSERREPTSLPLRPAARPSGARATLPPPANPTGSEVVPAPPSAVVTDAWVQLGTRDTLAFVFVNGTPRLPRSTALRWFRVPPGEVRLRVASEGCVAWEDVRVVRAGDSLRIGFRYPNCSQ